MTHKKLDRVGYYIDRRHNTIVADTYRNYLLDYGIDWCTSPRGNTDRIHIREDEWQTRLEDGTYEYEREYHMWTWGVNGNNPYYLGKSFDNEDDAELYLFELREDYVTQHNWDAPIFFENVDDAIIDYAQSVERSESVVRRYFQMKGFPSAAE